MRSNAFNALRRDLELLSLTFEPSLATVRLAFAGLTAMAAIWFL